MLLLTFMNKIVFSISLIGALFLLSFISECRGERPFALTSRPLYLVGVGKIEHAPSKMSAKKTDSCTERCHVNYMAY